MPPSPKRRPGSSRPVRRWRMPPSWRWGRSDRGGRGGGGGSIGRGGGGGVLRDLRRPRSGRPRHNLHGLAAMRSFGTSVELVEVLAAALAASNRRIIWRVLMVKAALGSRRDIRLLH